MNNKECIEQQKKIKTSEILFPEKSYEYKLKKPRFRKKQPETMIFETDDAIKQRNLKFFTSNNKSLADIYSGSKNLALKKIYRKKIIDQKSQIRLKFEPPVNLIDWERNISIAEERTNLDVKTKELINSMFEDENWETQIVYEDNDIPKVRPYVSLYFNDPNLIFDPVEDEKKKNKKKMKDIGDRNSKSKYNISNDKYYDFDTTAKSNLGVHGVQHSVPALKLFPEFYKTNLSNEELRNFHRPILNLLVGNYKFQPLKAAEYKSSNLVKKVSEMELCDDSLFQLVEYSEEFPPLLQNPGMVSLIINYFRKGHDDLEFYKDNEKFQTVNLNVDDPTPFFGYGDIKIGENMLAISNNLFKAPLYKHKSNDFLCTVKNNMLYLKKIDDILLAGQTYPSDVVYSPNSRKYNIFCKNRLKNIAYRYFNDKENSQGIQSNIIDEIFSFFSEGSKRKWMKEFCDLVKKGKENYWVLKQNEPMLGEEDLRKLVTPENVCQYESMLAAERKFLDSGIPIADEEDEEIKTAPWNLTKNFINVVNGKGLLELEGKADPTGIGEGFSFLKLRFKKGNEAEDRKAFNELQSQYKNIIQKIWNKQNESLSSYKEIIADIKEEKKESIKEKKEIDKTKPYIKIKRVYMIDNETIEEEEEIFDKRIIDIYLQLRKQSKEDKKALKCGSCGQLGHMKTNRICPNYSEKKVTKKSKESLRRKAKIYLMEKQTGLINAFFNLQYSSAFHRPVSTKKFPDYLNFIKQPIDLNIMKIKVRTFKYKTYESFANDIKLLRDNCYTYNGESHSLSKIAMTMVEMTENVYKEFKTQIEEAETVICEDLSETTSLIGTVE